MKPLHFVTALCAAAVLALTLVDASKAVARVTSPWQPATGAHVLGRSLNGITIKAVDDGRAVDMGTLERTLVLVFGPECGSCDVNVANWVDVIGRLRDRRVNVVALGMGDHERLSNYWQPFRGRMPVFAADSAAMRTTGIRGTPTTLFIDHGRVVAEYVGVLNRRESDLLVSVAGSPRQEAR